MKNLILLIAAIVTVATVISLAIPAVKSGVVRGPLARALNNSRQLQIELNSNSMDTKLLEDLNFPLQLSDLRRNENKVTDLLDKMEKEPGTYVIYNPKQGSSNSPFIRYFGPEGVAEMLVDGNGGIYSWDRWIEEQNKMTAEGAAANP